MRIKSLLLSLLLAGASGVSAADFINLTPAPKKMTQAEGSYVLPAGMTVGLTGNHEWNAEIDRFASVLNSATGLGVRTTDAASANVMVSIDPAIAPEGYSLTVGAAGVQIAASTTDGLFYAFQTFRKLLPANVMAEVLEQKEYALPLVTIQDEPRVEYRGFMLDVSRHFFTADEVKRMLKVMSYYKMNKFHWHLTDDQGWRIEMPEYPRLQTVGATASNAQIVDMFTKTEYWLNKDYGPYYYTRDELRDVVAYAKELHIDIIPEVDMPGHFSAVMAAYPEFSCKPDDGHSVAITGGIYSDVLNVANPGAMKFVYDVCDALVDIFPYPVIHIGGDECPTTAWQNNAECQAKYSKLGLTAYRQLQSLFIKDVADYLAKHGRKLGLWNESITESGADTEMIKGTDATIWCWYPADGGVDKAAELGLKAVYTPFSKTSDTKGSFYINRSQDPNDPPANGYKCDNVKSVYATVPFTENALKKAPETCYGVQGTFWAERVAYREYLEYLALPRLLAVAEIGWTPQAKKNWTSFQKRMSADRELLDYNDYRYSPYHMLDNGATPEEADLTLAAPLKQGRCYVFANDAREFKGVMLADKGQGLLAHSASAWDNHIWRAESVADNADKSQTVTLVNLLTGKSIASVGAASGKMAKPVNLGENAAEVKLYRYDGSVESFMLAIGDDILWCAPADGPAAPGTVRAGANKDSGVSPFQGAIWSAMEVTPTEFVCTDTQGAVIFTGTCGLPADADAKDYCPELKGYEYASHTVSGTTVNATYNKVADYVTYYARLANGIYIDIRESAGEIAIPEIPGCTLVTPGEVVTAADGTKSVTSIYSTEARIGVKKALNQITGEVEEGKAYLLRDAHADRNAFRCETSAGTVSGAKNAEDQTPLFTWTLEANKTYYRVKNLCTGQYVKALARSTTAKTGKTGGNFTFTWADDHWVVKGSNGMYWDGLDNLDLVGWDGGTGHPIEIYEFLGQPFHQVTVNSVDQDGKLLGSEVKYALPNQNFVIALPYRAGYSVSRVEGADALKNISADATVTIVYLDDNYDSIDEITTAGERSNAIYDLRGHRLTKVTRPGIYILNGTKTLLR